MKMRIRERNRRCGGRARVWSRRATRLIPDGGFDAREIPRPAGESAGLRDDSFDEISRPGTQDELARLRQFKMFAGPGYTGQTFG